MVAKILKTNPGKQSPKKRQASVKAKEEVSPPTETEEQMDVEDEQDSEDVTPENTVLVNNLPKETYRSDLAALFAPYGNIKLILLSVSVKDSIEGIIVFDTVEAATKSLQLNGSKYKSSALIVTKPKDSKIFLNQHALANSTNTVFVQNISIAIDHINLSKFFSSCGAIQYVKILKDHFTHVSRGKAFVCFANSNSVHAALKLDGSKLDGQAIAVKIFNKPEKKTTRAPKKPKLA